MRGGEEMGEEYRRADLPFVMVPMALLCGMYSCKEIAVYAALVKHCNDKYECFPRRGRLAKEAGMSVKTLDSTLKSMSEKEIVKISPRYTPDGRRTSNKYQVYDFIHVYSETA